MLRENKIYEEKYLFFFNYMSLTKFKIDVIIYK